ncbi:MAG: SDR family oxidoreductase [Hyphomicrobiales bacterium]|nr:SDR family oxidoreductase [Hyphomicrobiales bacterium]MBV9754382.1 SDR family oxidoreductase [Hyphomicrobiales bacterium]
MSSINGQTAWVTGAGTGIGRATAIALAKAGAEVVLSGRRKAQLDETASTILKAGGRSAIEVVDVADAAAVAATAQRIHDRFGRLDILINNAGTNILERAWSSLNPARVDELLGANLNGAFYCVIASLPFMRAQKHGLIINIASMAGKRVSPMSGPVYTAAKHAVVAMSDSINMEEFANGIRACAICPGEVATPILDRRPVPVSAADRAKMLQPEDLAQTVMFVANMPSHVCISEILLAPTWNRGYVAALKGPHIDTRAAERA